MGTKPIGSIFDEKKDVAVDPPGFSGLVEDAVDGSFVLLGVPDSDGNGLASYLRLGAPSQAAIDAALTIAWTPEGEPVNFPKPSATGEDLAQLVQGFTDDARKRDGTHAFPQTIMNKDGAGAFTESTPVDRKALQAESARLHTRGGWRDHTDGNRIVTTRGDKVEVIRGNYKLLVLGRQSIHGIDSDNDARRNLISNACGVEMSGGLVDNDSDDLRFPDLDGDGLNMEYAFDDAGQQWTLTTTVGKEKPDHVGSNYRIINQSYYDRKEEHFGSSDDRIPVIESTTWGKTVESLVDAPLNTSTTLARSVDNHTHTDLLTDATIAALGTEMRASGVGISASAVHIDAVAQIATLMPTITLAPIVDDKAGIHVDNHAGIHVDFRAGVHGDSHVGIHSSIHVGLHFDGHILADHLDVHIGPHVSIDLFKTKLEDTTIAEYHQRVESMVMAKIKTALSTQTIALGKVKISPLHIKS